MKRKNFLLTLLAAMPSAVFTQMKYNNNLRTNKGFKVESNEARFGVHFKMKGVTVNTLDIKISGKDTNGELAVFEQTGLTPNGGPPLHIHPFQDEWFMWLKGNICFRLVKKNIK
jgi:hypothetical protein